MSRFAQTVDRRLLLAGALSCGVGALAGGRRTVTAQDELPTTVVGTGDCSREPGVQLLIDFATGAPGVPQLSELFPPADWKLFSHPTHTLSLFIPPDWEAYPGWADSFSESGMPIWSDRPPATPQLTLTRIVSPGADAAFEYIAGSILGPPLSLEQAAFVAKQSVLGEDPRLRSICTYEDSNPLGPAIFQADRFGQSVHITNGVAIGLESSYLPATTITFNNYFGPRGEFEMLMEEVFLRFIVQFMGGGGSDPTPTPTPSR